VLRSFLFDPPVQPDEHTLGADRPDEEPPVGDRIGTRATTA